MFDGGKKDRPRRPPTGPPAELVAFFASEYEAHRGMKPAGMSYPRDCAIMKRLLVEGFTVAQLRVGIKALVRDEDEFMRKNGNALRLLPSRLNGYLTAPWWQDMVGAPAFEASKGEFKGHTLRVVKDYGEVWLEREVQGGPAMGYAKSWRRARKLK